MSRKPKAGAPTTTQAEPTQPFDRDENGFVLDSWGLPVSGPARVAVLATMGRPDPNDEPDAWAGGERAPTGGVADLLAPPVEPTDPVVVDQLGGTDPVDGNADATEMNNG